MSERSIEIRFDPRPTPQGMRRAQIELNRNFNFFISLTLTFGLIFFHSSFGICFICSGYRNVYLFGLIPVSCLVPISVSYTLDSCDISPKIKALMRVWKFYCLGTVMLSFNLIISFHQGFWLFSLLIIAAALDICRAFFVESIKSTYRDRLTTGTFQNILRFERFIQFEQQKISFSVLNEKTNDNTFTFHSRGPPKPLDIERTFRIWSNMDEQTMPYKISTELIKKYKIKTGPSFGLRRKLTRKRNKAELRHNNAMIDPYMTDEQGESHEKAPEQYFQHRKISEQNDIYEKTIGQNNSNAKILDQNGPYKNPSGKYDSLAKTSDQNESIKKSSDQNKESIQESSDHNELVEKASDQEEGLNKESLHQNQTIETSSNQNILHKKIREQESINKKASKYREYRSKYKPTKGISEHGHDSYHSSPPYFTHRFHNQLVYPFDVKQTVPPKYFLGYDRLPRFDIIQDLDLLKMIHEKYPEDVCITKKSLDKIFHSFDATLIYKMISYDMNRDVTWNTFKWNVRQINLERDSLYHALEDLKELSSKTTRITHLVFIIIMLSLANFIIKIDIPLFRIPAPIILFVFLMIFKDAFTPFVIMIFSDPFVSGDRVMIENEPYVVDKVNVFSSKFTKWDGSTVYISNKWLSEHPVRNLRLTAQQKFETHLYVSANTPVHKISRLKKFLDSVCKKYSQFFSSITCDVSDIQNHDRIKLLIYVEHQTNFQLGLYRWNRHQFFMETLIEFLKTNKIQYIPIGMPVKIDNAQVNTVSLQDIITSR